jgi:hypothetical protein
MAENPYQGRVPLHLRQDTEKVAKAVPLDKTSYREPREHELSYRNQYVDGTITPRNSGCTILRRYANGVLCFQYVAGEVISLLNKVRDGGHVTEYEKAILALVLPKPFGKLINAKIAQTMTKLSNDERMVLAHMVAAHLKEEINWNAGMGGGSVPGRSTTRS